MYCYCSEFPTKFDFNLLIDTIYETIQQFCIYITKTFRMDHLPYIALLIFTIKFFSKHKYRTYSSFKTQK